MLLITGALGRRAGGHIKPLAASLKASAMAWPPHSLSPPRYNTCARDRDSTHGRLSEKCSMNSYNEEEQHELSIANTQSALMLTHELNHITQIFSAIQRSANPWSPLKALVVNHSEAYGMANR